MNASGGGAFMTLDVACPYGCPGDRLWVRENFFLAPFGSGHDCNITDKLGQRRTIGYTASMDCESVRCAEEYGVKQSPPIHMPRWASRITLEITDIRVERLNDISEEDAKAEGVDRDFSPCDPEDREDPREVGYPTATAMAYMESIRHRLWFKSLWESIHGPVSWDANPWVWVVGFRRVVK
jgi:hypothetical protein